MNLQQEFESQSDGKIDDNEDVLDENGEIIERSIDSTTPQNKPTSTMKNSKKKDKSIKKLPHLQRLYIIDNQIFNNQDINLAPININFSSDIGKKDHQNYKFMIDTDTADFYQLNLIGND